MSWNLPKARTWRSVVTGVGIALVLPAIVSTQEVTRQSSADDRESVAITIYNQNFGLVREVRDVTLARGRVALEFADVAASIQPETVHIKSGRPEWLRVLEQNYQYDLLNPQKLLEKYVGRTVTVYRYNESTGRDEPFEAEVLSVNQGPILRIGDEITFNFPGRFTFPEIPENLIAKPTLVWLLDSREAQQELEVSYLTSGLNWKADYVIVIDEQDRFGDLTGWVTLTNQSGTAYEDAELKLVAGDVQRVSGHRGQPPMPMEALRAAADEAGFSEESFFEYHLYTLQRRTTLLNNEQKQVTLLEAAGIGIDKQLIFYGQPYYYRGAYGQVMSNQKVGVYLDIQNAEDNNLGMPLPKGIVRVYKADRTGSQQFIGEDQIDHTPRDERIRIKMGEAFDVVGDRRQMEYQVISSCVAESSWEIDLRNHKDEDVEIQVWEPIGGDWEILSSSHEATRVDARTFRFTVPVPARGEVTVEYRVRVTWC
jgi:hypothetical protein